MYIGINAVIIEAFGRCSRWESWQQVVQWLQDRKTHRGRLSDRFHRSRGWKIWAGACICNLYSCINNNNSTIDFICYVIASVTLTHVQCRLHPWKVILGLPVFKYAYVCSIVTDSSIIFWRKIFRANHLMITFIFNAWHWAAIVQNFL